MTAPDPAIAHRLARAIHECRCTPNRPDQLGKDMLSAYAMLETLTQAGLVVVDRAVVEGSSNHGRHNALANRLGGLRQCAS